MDASHCTASSSVSPLAPAEESEGAAKRMRAEEPTSMELEGECGDFESTAFSAPGSFFSSSKKLLWYKDDDMQSAENEITQAAAEKEALLVEIKSVEAKIESVEGEIRQVEADIKAVEAKIDKLEEKLSGGGNGQLSKKEEKLRDEVEQLRDGKKQLRNEEIQLRDKEAQLRGYFRLKEQALSAAKDKKSRLREEMPAAIPKYDTQDGIQSEYVQFALHRTRILSRIYRAFVNNRFVHIAAPPAWGKTSLLQLFSVYAARKNPNITCIYIPMADWCHSQQLRERTGINVATWSVDASSVCSDTSRIFIVMLDDAQRTYGDVAFWSALIKGDKAGGHCLPGNIRFLISATYSLVTLGTPVDFEVLPKLTIDDMRLTEEEANTFINRRTDRANATAKHSINPLLMDPHIRGMIVATCNGHIGALEISCRKIINRFMNENTVSVGDVVDYYLSSSILTYFDRCFFHGIIALPDEIREMLIDVLAGGVAVCRSNTFPDELKTLLKSGILLLTSSDPPRIEFASVLAARYINWLIFPQVPRAGYVEALQLVTQRGIIGLMEAVVSGMSASVLRQSTVPSSSTKPPEAVFLHLMMAGLQAQAPVYCFVCPGISRIFPLIAGAAPSQPPSSATGIAVSTAATVASTTTPAVVNFEGENTAISGKCDFYINGGLRWAIEALVNGSELGEHMSLFDTHRKYAGLGYKDYLVVDFRVSESGEPTDVHRHEHLMTVFFKQGDFCSCYVQSGLEGEPRALTLAP